MLVPMPSLHAGLEQWTQWSSLMYHLDRYGYTNDAARAHMRAYEQRWHPEARTVKTNIIPNAEVTTRAVLSREQTCGVRR